MDSPRPQSSPSGLHLIYFYTLKSESSSNDGGRYLRNGLRTLEFEEARNEMPFVAQAQTPVCIDYNLISLPYV